MEYLDKMLEDNNKLSGAEFHRMIAKKFSVQIPAPTIRRFLSMKLYWITVRARTGPMITEMNKIKRVEFAKCCITAKDSFDDMFWTYESSIQLVRQNGKGTTLQASVKAPTQRKICIFD